MRVCELTQDGVKVHVVYEYIYSFSIEKDICKVGYCP